MPFKAIIDGHRVISIDYNEEEWENLKLLYKKEKINITLPCCGSLAYPRTSKLGTKHFVHKIRGDCLWAGESLDHLKIKEIIYQVCKNNGWNAEPEYKAIDWVTDVFCIKDDERFAFEVQLSRQGNEYAEERQQKYERDEINAIWLSRYDPFLNNIPAIRLIKEKNDSVYYVFPTKEKKMQLTHFIENVLSGNIKYKRIANVRTTIDIYARIVPYFPHNVLERHYAVHSVVQVSCRSNCGKRIFYEIGKEIEVLGYKDKEKVRNLLLKNANFLSVISNISLGKLIFTEPWILEYEQPSPDFKLFESINVEGDTGKVIHFPHWCFKSKEGFCGE